MNSFFKWLEEDKARLRKVLALGIFVVWVFATIASYIAITYKHDTVAIYALVTAQLVTVLGFYMVSKVSKD